MAQITEVNDGYTENYGKVEINTNDLINKYFFPLQQYMLSINKNRYIIHIIDIYFQSKTPNGCNTKESDKYKIVIDNYGDYIYFKFDNYHHYNRSSFGDSKRSWSHHSQHNQNKPHFEVHSDIDKRFIDYIHSYLKISTNILPDKLIDIIKAFSKTENFHEEMNRDIIINGQINIKKFSEPLEKIKILAKDYHDILIKYKSLNQSKLKDYDKLLEQIKNDNDIEKLNKEIIEKDILINSLKKENESLIKDNKSMDNEIKQLRELVVTMNNFSKIF